MKKLSLLITGFLFITIYSGKEGGKQTEESSQQEPTRMRSHSFSAGQKLIVNFSKLALYNLKTKQFTGHLPKGDSSPQWYDEEGVSPDIFISSSESSP